MKLKLDQANYAFFEKEDRATITFFLQNVGKGGPGGQGG